MRDFLLYSSFGFSGNYRGCRPARTVTEGFWLIRHFLELEWNCEGRVTPEPRQIPPVRIPLEMEAGLLDSDVQELFGAEELAGEELASGLQLQWATQTELPNVVRLFEVNCCAIPLTGAGGGGIFAVLARAVAGLDLGTQEGDVDLPLTGGPSGAAHPSDSCAVVFIEIAADVESQLDIISEVPGESIGFSPDGRLPHIPSSVLIAAWDERCSVVEESGALSPPGSAEEEQGGFSLPVAKARSAKKGSETFGAKRGRGPSSEASVPSRIPGNSARSHVRICWPPLKWWSCSHSSTVQFEPCDVGNSGCFAKVKQPSATRFSHSAWSRRRHQSHPSPCQSSPRSPTFEAM